MANTIGTATPADGEILAQTSVGEQWITNVPHTMVVTAKTAAYTIKITDEILIASPTGGAFNMTLPSAATCAQGQEWEVINKDSSANAVTFVPNGTDNINGANSNAAKFGSSTQWKRVRITCDGAANFYISTES